MASDSRRQGAVTSISTDLRGEFYTFEVGALEYFKFVYHTDGTRCEHGIDASQALPPGFGESIFKLRIPAPLMCLYGQSIGTISSHPQQTRLSRASKGLVDQLHSTARDVLENTAVLGGWAGAREMMFYDSRISDAIAKAACKAVLAMLETWAGEEPEG